MGEVVGAALVAHVPTIMLPEETRLEINEGKEITLVPRPIYPYEIWQAVTSPPTPIWCSTRKGPNCAGAAKVDGSSLFRDRLRLDRKNLSHPEGRCRRFAAHPRDSSPRSGGRDPGEPRTRRKPLGERPVTLTCFGML